MNSTDYEYVGGELELFAEAHNWKSYFSDAVKKYIRGRVLEVGAGLGGTSTFLLNDDVDHLTLLEPDGDNVKVLKEKENDLGVDCEVIQGTTADLGSKKYDAIVYIDVLEHIEHDDKELMKAETLLADNGVIVALSPAHQNLYSPFDKAVGHYRRYNRALVEKHCPDGLEITSNRYLDSIGYFASLANRLLLSQSMPTPAQIKLWDRFFVPASRWVDPCLNYHFGKSLLTTFKKVK
jgi:SAM-dependent methyltransferase